MMHRPNFFIIGAMRCGSTALSEYLRGNPHVFFSTPKEVNYFNTDSPEKNRPHATQNLYLQLFEGAQGYRAIGEGSVQYLFSKDAISNILAFNPAAKFIVMLRNPIDAAYSLHGRMLQSRKENVCDFQAAWRLQDQRKLGKDIPKRCPDPKLLQYGEVYKLGEQLECLYKSVPRERVHIIFYDDFRNDARRVYQNVLAFLDVPDDGRVDFDSINAHRVPRSNAALFFVDFFGLVKSKLGVHRSFGIARRIKSDLIFAARERPALDPDFKKELINYFAKDIRTLASLTRRDLSHWFEP